jgi:hypothetical protein
VANSIAAGNFRLLEPAKYFALQGPTARRLFRYLDYRRWRGATRLDEVAFSLKVLADELPIDRASPSHIKRTLDPAHAELIQRGHLASATYEDRPVSGKKRPDVWVRYCFATAEPPASPRVLIAPPRVESDSEYVRETVAELLELLKDPHSRAFYVKVARTLPSEMLRGVIGYAQESLRDGVPIEVARRMFTKTVKDRAEAAGLEL